MRALICCLALAMPAVGLAHPGSLDRDLIATATNAEGVFKVKIFTQPDGTVRKLAVYHRDAKLVPQKVQDAARKLFGSAPIQYFESEQYLDLGQIFEVEVKTAKGEEEGAFKPDGTLVYRETPLTAKTVPAQLLKIAQGLVPEGKLIEAERKRGPNVDEFALKFDVKGVIHYIRMQPNATIINHAKRVPAVIEVLLPR